MERWSGIVNECFSQDSRFQKSLKEGEVFEVFFVMKKLQLQLRHQSTKLLHHFVTTAFLPTVETCSAFEVFVNRDIGKARAA